MPYSEHRALRIDWPKMKKRSIGSASILWWGVPIATLVAIAGFIGAPWFFDLNVPETSGADRVIGITGVRQSALFIAGGIIAIVTLALTNTRDRETQRKNVADTEHARAQIEELRTQRTEQHTFDTERELRARFVTASQLMSSEQAVTRTAGLYAIAALADDWASRDNLHERQVCINILCSYVRSFWDPGSDQAGTEALARTSALSIIADHLRADRPNSWQQTNIDLHGAIVAYEADMSRMILESNTFVNLNHSRIDSGGIDFGYLQLDGGAVNLSSTNINGGTVGFFGARLTRGTIDLSFCDANGGRVEFGFSRLMGATVDLSQSHLTGTLIDFDGITMNKGKIDASWSTLDGGELSFDDFILAGGRIDFNESRLISGRIDMRTMERTGGIVSYLHLELHAEVFADESKGEPFSPRHFRELGTPKLI